MTNPQLRSLRSWRDRLVCRFVPHDVDEIHVHVHVHVDSPAGGTADNSQLNVRLDEIVAHLTSLETKMSDTSASLDALTTAVAAVGERISVDFAHMQDLLDQALATDVADQATIDQLRAEAAAVAGSVDAVTAQLTSIDPLTDFPPLPPPVDTPPADTPPADTPPGQTP